jgi:hypothetical protein
VSRGHLGPASLNRGDVYTTTIILYAIYYEYVTVIPYSRNVSCKKLDGAIVT